MDVFTPNWETQRRKNAQAFPLVLLRTPMGDRWYGIVHPNLTTSLSGGYFDADSFFDGSLYFDAEAVLMEQGARLTAITQIARSVQPVDSSVLGAWGESSRAASSVDLTNGGDQAMSKMIGQEYVLNQSAQIYATFPGLDVTDAMPKMNAKVKRWQLTKQYLRLDIEEL